MEASTTVSQPNQSRKSPISRSGVLTIHGFGVRVRMQRGHLEIEDGVGPERRNIRLARVGHGLRRLVMIGSNGFVTFEALRWLADQDAAFVMLERDGRVLCVTGPVRSSDIKLRRSQAIAAYSGADVVIARELISRKLAGQEQVAREKLHDAAAAQAIADFRLGLAEAENLDAVRFLESQGAVAYWAAWRDVPVAFPRKDLPRIPEHWRTFGTRKSLLTGSPRLATNPPNAMLNYLYAITQSESRLAAAALGLDPGLGFIHMDAPARDSLACDLMEAVRPQVDAYVLDWLTQQPLNREWFFEQRDGNCRLMANFAARLAETAPTWARAVAPIAEWVAHVLWSTTKRRNAQVVAPPTRLTQSRKREARGPSTSLSGPTPEPQRICRGCGTPIRRGRSYCPACAVTVSTETMLDIAKKGRAVSHTPEAEARRADALRRNVAAQQVWVVSGQSSPDKKTYDEIIQPRLAGITNSAIASALGVSLYYAAEIRRGRRRPHPRHWQALLRLVGIC